MECDYQYQGSGTELDLPLKNAGFVSVYGCVRCPCQYATDLDGTQIYAYTPFDRPTCSMEGATPVHVDNIVSPDWMEGFIQGAIDGSKKEG